MKWIVIYEDPRDAMNFTNDFFNLMMNKKVLKNSVFFESYMDKSIILHSVEKYGRVKELIELKHKQYKLIFLTDKSAKKFEKIYIDNLNSTKYDIINLNSIKNAELNFIKNVERDNNKIFFKSDLPISLISDYFSDFSIEDVPIKIEIIGHRTLKLQNNFGELYNSDYMSDITINVGNKQYKAHKLILASSGDYFKQLFSYNPNISEITIDDVEIYTFELLLKMIYGIDVKFDSILDKLKIILLAENFSINIENKDDEILKDINILKEYHPELYDEAMKLIDLIYPYGLPRTELIPSPATYHHVPVPIFY